MTLSTSFTCYFPSSTTFSYYFTSVEEKNGKLHPHFLPFLTQNYESYSFSVHHSMPHPGSQTIKKIIGWFHSYCKSNQIQYSKSMADDFQYGIAKIVDAAFQSHYIENDCVAKFADKETLFKQLEVAEPSDLEIAADFFKKYSNKTVFADCRCTQKFMEHLIDSHLKSSAVTFLGDKKTQLSEKNLAQIVFKNISFQKATRYPLENPTLIPSQIFSKFPSSEVIAKFLQSEMALKFPKSNELIHNCMEYLATLYGDTEHTAKEISTVSAAHIDLEIEIMESVMWLLRAGIKPEVTDYLWECFRKVIASSLIFKLEIEKEAKINENSTILMFKNEVFSAGQCVAEFPDSRAMENHFKTSIFTKSYFDTSTPSSYHAQNLITQLAKKLESSMLFNKNSYEFAERAKGDMITFFQTTLKETDQELLSKTEESEFVYYNVSEALTELTRFRQDFG